MGSIPLLLQCLGNSVEPFIDRRNLAFQRFNLICRPIVGSINPIGAPQLEH